MNIQNALLLSEVVVSKEPFQDPASSLSLFDDKKELKAHYQNIVLRSKRAAFNEMFTKGEVLPSLKERRRNCTFFGKECT